MAEADEVQQGTSRIRAAVKFDYKAQLADELSLKAGEFVSVTGVEERGWYRGIANGEEGVFPWNYVDIGRGNVELLHNLTAEWPLDTSQSTVTVPVQPTPAVAPPDDVFTNLAGVFRDEEFLRLARSCATKYRSTETCIRSIFTAQVASLLLNSATPHRLDAPRIDKCEPRLRLQRLEKHVITERHSNSNTANTTAQSNSRSDTVVKTLSKRGTVLFSKGRSDIAPTRIAPKRPAGVPSAGVTLSSPAKSTLFSPRRAIPGTIAGAREEFVPPLDPSIFRSARLYESVSARSIHFRATRALQHPVPNGERRSPFTERPVEEFPSRRMPEPEVIAQTTTDDSEDRATRLSPSTPQTANGPHDEAGVQPAIRVVFLRNRNQSAGNGVKLECADATAPPPQDVQSPVVNEVHQTEEEPHDSRSSINQVDGVIKSLGSSSGGAPPNPSYAVPTSASPPARLLQHKRPPKADQGFDCMRCGHILPTIVDLKQHLLTHAKNREHCRIACRKPLANAHVPDDQEVTETVSLPAASSSGTRVLRVRAAPYVCDRAFRRENHLQQHAKIHKPKPSPTKRLPGERPYECEECGRRWLAKCHLDAHLFAHCGLRAFQCEHCPKRFIFPDALLSHRRVHSVKRFKCAECGRKFYLAVHLRRHALSHTGDRPFECEECGRRYRRNDKLRKHLRIHMGLKGWDYIARPLVIPCDLCKKLFRTNWEMKLHRRSHTGERPHGCTMCECRFTSTDGLRKHLRRRHTS